MRASSSSSRSKPSSAPPAPAGEHCASVPDPRRRGRCSSDSPWPGLDAALICHWNAGLSTNAIGERLGVGKNAVVGRTSRLMKRGLIAARPNPGKGGQKADPARVRAARHAREMQLKGAAEFAKRVRESGGPARVAPRFAEEEPSPAPVPKPASVPIAVAPPPVPRRIVECCWPIGEPCTKAFRFCDDPSVHGKPYCEQHARLAYVRAIGPGPKPEVLAA